MTFLLSVHYHLDFPHNVAPEICQNTEKPVKKKWDELPIHWFDQCFHVHDCWDSGQALMLNLNKTHSI